MAVKQAGIINFLTAFAFSFRQSQEGSPDHGIGATYATINFDRPSDTIHLTGTTFHARQFPNHAGFAAIHFKYCLRANCHTHPASIALFRIKHERVN
jgi:hypothetical protein